MRNMKTNRIKIFLLFLIIACSVLVNIPQGSSLTINEVKGPYRYGGTFRVPLSEDMTTFNPLITFKGVDLYARIFMYPYLLINDPNWSFDAPYLARDFDVSEDGKTYTFYLYENATWTDGEPLTAEDVKFSIEYYKEHDCPVTTPHVKNIESVETPDDYTAVFNLANASATWVTVDLSNLLIIPEHIWSEVDDPLHFENEDPVGAGPFKLSKWVKGQYVEFVANEDFWLGRPYLDKVILVVIVSRDSRILAYKQGSIDRVEIQGNEVPDFLNLPNTTIYQTADPGLTVLGINNLKAPGNDKNFRQALAHTIDKIRIAETVYYGYAKPNNHYLTSPYNASGNWLNPDVKKYPYNLTLAAQKFDEAGYVDSDGDGYRDYPNGTDLTLTIETTGSIPTWIRAAEIIVEDWKEIGFDTEVISVDLGQQISDMVTTKKYQLTYYRCGPASADPGEMLGWCTEAQSEGGLNTAAWVNETFEELQEKQLLELDKEERREMVYKQQEILMEELPNIPTVEGTNLLAVSTEKFEGYINSLPYGPTSNMDLYNFLSIHLKGSPPLDTSTLSLTIPSSIELGESITLQAELTDEEGNPIEGEYIDFSVKGTIIGSSRTSSSGMAELPYTPQSKGSYEVKAQFRGSSIYKECSSESKTVSVSVEEEPEEAEPETNYTLYYIAAILVLILVVAGILLMRKS